MAGPGVWRIRYHYQGTSTGGNWIACLLRTRGSAAQSSEITEVIVNTPRPPGAQRPCRQRRVSRQVEQRHGAWFQGGDTCDLTVLKVSRTPQQRSGTIW
ncbi:unnamed protein product, partial [Mycena citricolor]